jgi:hypothetical protein
MPWMQFTVVQFTVVSLLFWKRSQITPSTAEEHNFRILWFVLQGQQYETALVQISSFLTLWTGREFWEMDFNCCFVKKFATLFSQEPFLISCKWPELHWKLHWKQWNRVTFRCTAMIKKFTISYIYKSSIFVAQSLWQMEQKGFNHQTWHWMNINIMPFHIPSWWVTIFMFLKIF